MKPLKELNLMDRFLFAEAMENPIVNQAVLSVIMGEEIHLQEKAQTEKEFRSLPQFRSIRMDVYAIDDKNRLYDAEVQNRNTKICPDGADFIRHWRTVRCWNRDQWILICSMTVLSS